MEEMLINERFKSPNKEFEKVYSLFRKKDYFSEKSQVKRKQEEFVRFLKKGDPMATKVFKQNKENMKSSLSFIEDMVMDYNKKNAFEDFQVFSTAVNDIEMKDSKSASKSADSIKRKIHNNSQKYTMALYSAIRKQKFNNYKDVHKDVDELISKNESVNEAYVVLHSPKKGVKPVATAAYRDKKDAEKWAKDLGGITMIVKKKMRGVDEGKKRFKRQDGIGKAKYTISYHDGKKKHKDGSDFFDIKIFKNKKDLSDFVGTLAKQGYKLTRESVNEGRLSSKDAKKLSIGSKIKTKKHTYTIKGFGNKANAFRQFEVENEKGDLFNIQVSLYGTNDIGVAKGRSLVFRDTEMLESVNERINPKFYDARVQYIDPKSKKKFVGDVVRYDNGEYKVNLGKDGRFEKYILAKEKDLKIVSKSKKRTFESVNEAKYNYKADALTAYFKGKIDAKELDRIARDDFKSGIATKKELSNFLSNKFTQDVMSDTYGIPAGTLIKRVRGLMKFAEGKGDGVPQGYNPMVEDKKQIKDLVKKVKHEKLFYDVLDTMEKKYGKRQYRIWLEKSLKGFGVNPKHYDYRTNAAAEEKLFQLGK